GVARRRPRRAAAHRAAGDARCRGGALPLRSRACAVPAPRNRAGRAGARAAAGGHAPRAGDVARVHGAQGARAGGAGMKWAAPLAIVAAVIGGWELFARFGGVENYLLPAPSEVFRALVDDRGL